MILDFKILYKGRTHITVMKFLNNLGYITGFTSHCLYTVDCRNMIFAEICTNFLKTKIWVDYARNDFWNLYDNFGNLSGS
jgi:hypothetical protein